MRLYLAAPWIDRHEMPHIASRFEQAGHTITHKWWEVEVVEENELSVEILRQQAARDFVGVWECDKLVLINSKKSEGKAVEQGIALALDKDIIAVGRLGEQSKNVFHYLLNYTWVPTIEEAITCLQT